MPKRMLIDAAHPEETRVVVTSGTRLEEFDFESSTKKQVKGNIYLAKITRVEPSLQAAFVDYGGNRHGFLAFSEIHPDYYRIPVSDRPHGDTEPPNGNGSVSSANGADGPDDAGVPLAAALPEMVPVPDSGAADDEPAGEEPGREAEAVPAESPQSSDDGGSPIIEGPVPEWADAPFADRSAAAEPARFAEADSAAAAPTPAAVEPEPPNAWDAPVGVSASAEPLSEPSREPATMALRAAEESLITAEIDEVAADRYGRDSEAMAQDLAPRMVETEPPGPDSGDAEDRRADIYAEDPETDRSEGEHAEIERGETEGFTLEPVESERYDRNGGGQGVETFGGDEVEEVEEADAERRRTQPMRHYKIQEVIKRRQIMLVQVAKEERGNKGAALTTYLSLAGRYCVLMPNTNRGGGVSRKITSIADRRRLKDILEELDIPEGMGVIVRTAGAERSKAEIKRDYEYLLRLWNEIRDLTLQSTAPALIYEEGNLIKRSIRDLYARDIDEVLVEGEEGYKTAKAFMRTLMPSHAKRVQPYRDPQIGLFHRFQIESQIDAIHSPIAQLRSGGYVVINQTEALVSIDVNSGRSTRERNIEETALRTNLEAADEIARQLRLRDLAGLIVIDFIDMEEHRNQVAVERRLKEALKNDRARIQVGRISPFGLLEMSRQRLRPSLAEASTQPCPHCGGTGFIRSVESTALYVLRSIEEEGIRRRSAEICVYVPTTVALYILNQKRESLNQIEARYLFRVMIARDDTLIPPAFRLERLRPYGAGEVPPVRSIQAPVLAEDDEAEEEVETEVEVEAETEIETTTAAGEVENGQSAEDDRARRRRRRRRRRPDEVRDAGAPAPIAVAAETGASEEPVTDRGEEAEAAREGESEAERRRRRRGRRGGRMRPRREDQHDASVGPAAAEDVTSADFDSAAEAERPVQLETWPAEAAIETASLAPFAGESIGAPEVTDEPPVNGRTEADAVPISETEQGAPFVSEPERVLENADAAAHAALQPGEPAFAVTEVAQPAPEEPSPAAVAAPEPAPEAPAYAAASPVQSTPTPDMEAAPAGPKTPEPAYADAVRQPEPAALELVRAEPAPAELAHAEPARLGEEVLTVTEKPSNPRRGWWQRLTSQ